MAQKWMYLQYLRHLVTYYYTDSDLALALLAIAERNLPLSLCVSCTKVGVHVTWKRNRNVARRWRSVWVAVQHDGTWLILAAWMSGTCIKRFCITFGLFDITQPMGNVRHLMHQLDWPHGLAMALQWPCTGFPYVTKWRNINGGPATSFQSQFRWPVGFVEHATAMTKLSSCWPSESRQTLSNHFRMRTHDFRCLPYTEAGRASVSTRPATWNKK